MATLNRAAAEAALRRGVHAATDVTGFGLLGHALGLARESRLTLEIRAAALPLLPGRPELALRHQAGGLKANRRALRAGVAYEGAPPSRRGPLVFDPQTSGGLLLLVPEAARRRAAGRAAGGRARSVARASAGPRALVLRGAECGAPVFDPRRGRVVASGVSKAGSVVLGGA